MRLAHSLACSLACVALASLCSARLFKDGPDLVRSGSSWPNATKPPYDWAEALHKALLFLEAQRSGSPPSWRLAWRKASCFNCQDPHTKADLSQGYYEAGGSYLKVSLQEAFTLTQLAWALHEHRDGFYKVGELDAALDLLRWGTDYMLQCYDAKKNAFVALLGNRTLDFQYYGPPEEYEKWLPSDTGGKRAVTYASPAARSSEIFGEAAAVLAASSLVFNATDPEYAAQLVSTAQQLYNTATAYQGSYMTSEDAGLQQIAQLYPSSGFYDELAWAAAWLYKATNYSAYLEAATLLFGPAQKAGNTDCCGFGVFSWDTKTPGYVMLMASLVPTNLLYLQTARQFFDAWLPSSLTTIPTTKNGLPYPYEGWGSLRYANNAGFLAMLHSRTLQALGGTTDNQVYAARLFNWGQAQMTFALGDSGRSYMVGFGKSPPTHAFIKYAWNSYLTYKTRGDSFVNQSIDFHTNPGANRFIAYGALVGGPASINGTGLPDSREFYQYTEPALDYSGAMITALAALCDYYETLQPFDNCKLNLGWGAKGAPKPPQGFQQCAKVTVNASAPSTADQGMSPSQAVLVNAQGLPLTPAPAPAQPASHTSTVLKQYVAPAAVVSSFMLFALAGGILWWVYA